MQRARNFANIIKCQEKFSVLPPTNTTNSSISIECKRCYTCHTDQEAIRASAHTYVQDQYNAWLADPYSVSNKWKVFFQNSAQGQTSHHPIPSMVESLIGDISSLKPSYRTASGGGGGGPEKQIEDALAVQNIIRSFQVRGHHLAQLDPLGITNYSTERAPSVWPAEIPYWHYAEEHMQLVQKIKSEIDLNQVFKLPPRTYIGGKDTSLPLKEILSRLEDVYCKHIGVEYMHMNSIVMSDWIRQRMETPGARKLPTELRRLTLARLIRAALFENFFTRKYPGEKRFGGEGVEVFIPALKQLIDKSTLYGTEVFNIAMAHRGRLNVLANVCKKDLVHIFTQFHGLDASDEGSGDLKYHWGTCEVRLNRITNKNIKVTLAANPSHLECSAPVALGKTRAEQFYRGDTKGEKVLSFILHGDSALCGQGVVYETINLSDLPAYTTHGTIHIVTNNQLGFSTDPRANRSSTYCTGVGFINNSPIIHVNSDDPDSVIHVCNLAADWRGTFHKDIFIDIIGYRRFGHSENDEPRFTQPLMYKRIQETKPCVDKYTELLIKEGVVKADEVKDVKVKYDKLCDDAFIEAKAVKQIKHKDWIDSPWHGFFEGRDQFKVEPTGIKEETLVHIGTVFSAPPNKSAHFEIHPGIDRILSLRKKMIEKREFDFPIAEAFAFGSLLKEGKHVRLSGEDCERGTFSQRHHVFHHQTMDQAKYIQLNHLYPDQATYIPTNSSLSEYAVLGFELGYSQTNPNSLVIWEAQFGDFINTAQVIVDQFISAGQEKWMRQAGLVMQLPHGLEGMGPEHSSCRPERFFQMCNDDPDVMPELTDDFAIRQLYECNWIIVYLSSPANLTHVLRRQCYLPFRKPLVYLSPKSLLRNPNCKSSFDEIIDRTEFVRVIPDNIDPKEVKKVVFTCGKLYYDIQPVRQKKKLDKKVALVRIEQIFPFPYDLILKEAAKYPDAQLCFAQEEPKNQGFWSFVSPRFHSCLPKREVKLVSRPVMATPATGFAKTHKNQQLKVIEDALTF